MRRLTAFACEGETLIGTLDEADGAAGLLIVSGGNEIRAGAHRGMAHLAARLAANGHPVFRFDRRGVGDSSGANRGFAGSFPDILAAATCFRLRAPHLNRLIALGNCDAATALAMFAEQAGIDALILTNPWLEDRDAHGLPPAPAIRARYLARLRNPASWSRSFSFEHFIKGLLTVFRKRPEPDTARYFTGLRLPTTIILSERDATAQTYKGTIRGTFANIRTASHSFADAFEELESVVLAAMRRYSAA